VFYEWKENLSHVPIGRLETSLRELTLKNSLWPIVDDLSRKYDPSYLPSGLFVVFDKQANFSELPSPPIGFEMTIRASGLEALKDESKKWLTLSEASSNSVIQTSSKHRQAIEEHWTLLTQNCGGYDSPITFTLWSESKCVGQFSTTLRELCFCALDGASTFRFQEPLEQNHVMKKENDGGDVIVILEVLAMTPFREAQKSHTTSLSASLPAAPKLPVTDASDAIADSPSTHKGTSQTKST